MQQRKNRWVFACLVMTLAACAFNVVSIKKIPAEMKNAPSSVQRLTLDKGVDVRLDTGYSRKLKPGTVWHYVGVVSQGDVYRTRDQVLTVEGSHIYEAYIVLSENNLVGFYLPGEKAFSPLGAPVPLSMKTK